VDLIVRRGRVGEKYNVGSGVEKTVEEIADFIIAHLGLLPDVKQYVPDRLQNDRRYLLDSTKLRTELGWAPQYEFNQGLKETIDWYVENDWWWKPIKSGEYWKEYYKRKYSGH
jgi:dTDP-glucose 4,6-dehydratase